MIFHPHTRSVLPLLLIPALLGPLLPAQESDEPALPRRQRDPEKVHDPSTILESNKVCRSLSTGMGITVLREADDGRWLAEGSIFALDALPAWHKKLVPDNRGHLWAPDLIQIKDQIFVYYSVSTFGKNVSAMGLVVGKSLDPKSPDWSWEDRGPVINSTSDSPYNAIDPAIFQDDNGRLYMSFGSFWEGIHLVELNPRTGLRLDPAKAPIQLAKTAEIEAPFICKGPDNDYFLFVNWGLCCRGTRSTYEIRVGRAKSVVGPYLDKEGQDMRAGGGTLLLGTQDRYIGPGHPSLLERDGATWLAHHFYDRDNRGRSRLRLLPFSWGRDGWPVVQTNEPKP